MAHCIKIVLQTVPVFPAVLSVPVFLESGFDLSEVDAVTIPGISYKQEPIIKGDAKSISIAAASIIDSSLFFSESFLESLTYKILQSFGRITAQVTTGPARGPLPEK